MKKAFTLNELLIAVAIIGIILIITVRNMTAKQASLPKSAAPAGRRSAAREYQAT